MTGEAFNQHLDFVFFIHVLSLFFLAAFTFRIYKRHRLLHWLWFTFFCLSVAPALGLLILAYAQLAPTLLHNIAWSLVDLGLFFLALYGLHGQPRQSFRLAGYILTGMLLVAPAAGAVFWGMRGFILITLLGLAPVAGLLALLAIFRNRDRQLCHFVKPLYPLLALYVCVFCLAPAVHLLVRAGLSGWSSLQQPLPVPIYAVLMAVTAAASAATFAHSAAFGEAPEAGRERRGLHAYVIGLSVVGFAMFFGFTLTKTLGDRADHIMRKELFMRASAVANALEPKLVGRLKAVPDDVHQPYYRQLLRQLTKIRQANPDLRYVYITQMRPDDRQVVFALDIEPPTSQNYILPGLAYSEAPQKLKDIFTTGKPDLVGPYTDRWGTWISGLAPVKNDTGAILGVLGMDVSAKVVQTAVSLNRCLGITITFLLCLVGAVLAIITQRNKDLAAANQRLNEEIAQHQQTQQSLSESEEKYRNLVERANDGIAILQEYKLVYANPRLGEMVGAAPEQLKGRPLEFLVEEEQRPRFLELYRNRLRGEDASGGYETVLATRDGEGVPVEINAGITPFNHQPAVLIIARDITERKKAVEELCRSEKRYRELSISDDLTTLYNSRYFYTQLQKEIARTRRYHHDLSLVLLDIDGFKEVNDRHGHVEGDRFLAELGKLIKQVIRETDAAFRYGGEEFSLILPETASPEAVALAERVRLAISGHLFVLGDGVRVSKTVSLGVAQYRPEEDYSSFVKRADHNLYHAKKQGKNQTYFA